MRLYNLISILVLVITAHFFRCSNSSQSVAGATDNPNCITGVAVYDGELAVDKEIILKRILVTEKGDSIAYTLTDITDSNGIYKFDDIDSGNYVIYHEDSLVSGILSGIKKEKETSKVANVLKIDSKVLIKGRALEAGNAVVTIPGCGKRTTTDEEGFYVLPDVPAGNYPILFIHEATANYLPVVVNTSEDTVYVKDVRLTASAKEANKIWQPFETRLENNLSITIEDYSDTSEPEWYSGKSFDNIEYQEEVTSFVFDNESGDLLWANPENWDPDGVPGVADTALIASRECILPENDSILPSIKLSEGGVLNVTRDITEADISVDNSTIKLDKNAVISMNSEIDMSGDTLVLLTGPDLDSDLFITGSITGEGSIIKEGGGAVTLEGDTIDVDGTWYVKGGEVRPRMPYALGRSSIYVEPLANLDIENDRALWDTDTLCVRYDESLDIYGTVFLDADTRVKYLKVNGSVLKAGEYVRADYPEVFKGENTLVVEYE